jgi:hypothetical protein
MAKTVTPLLPEPGVWTGMAQANVWAPLRWRHAKIHRGSRPRILGPHQEAGYTSAVVTVAPNPVSLLQSGGVHIRPHMTQSERTLLHTSGVKFGSRLTPFARRPRTSYFRTQTAQTLRARFKDMVHWNSDHRAHCRRSSGSSKSSYLQHDGERCRRHAVLAVAVCLVGGRWVPLG